MTIQLEMSEYPVRERGMGCCDTSYPKTLSAKRDRERERHECMTESSDEQDERDKDD